MTVERHGQEWQLLEDDGRLLATLHFVGQGEAPELRHEMAGGEAEDARLSRFALLRFDPDVGMVLECPLSFYRLVLHDANVTAWIASLGHGQNHDGSRSEQSGQARSVLWQWLWAMQAVCPAGEREDATHAHWEFHDLLFHAQSRPGRRTGRIRPYRWRGVFEPLPLVKSGMGEALALPEPDGELAQTTVDKKFWDVLSSRRSRRAFAEQPIRLETLSTFLHHACRIQSQRPDELGGVSFRPSPSAGALHGLELYVLTHAYAGANEANEKVTGDKGLALYHYEPLQHRLERLPVLAEDAAKLELLAEQARRMAASQSVPAAYFISTARFRRYQWKYAQLAYSVMLKDLGSLHQTMSLCAEALGLSSVILGDTPTEPLLELAGLDWLEESPVGSFSLGWPR